MTSTLCPVGPLLKQVVPVHVVQVPVAGYSQVRRGKISHFAFHGRNFIPLFYRVSEIFLTHFKIAL